MKYLFPIFISILFFSCDKKDDDTTDPNPINNGNITSMLVEGTFYISRFVESGNDETSDFQGYTFTFDPNGGAAATIQGNTTNGSWTLGSDDSKRKLILNFGTVDPLEELNEDWEVMSLSNSQIDLRHISGGDGSIDELSFKRQ